MVSHPETGLDSLIGSDRDRGGGGGDINIHTICMLFKQEITHNKIINIRFTYQ